MADQPEGPYLPVLCTVIGDRWGRPRGQILYAVVTVLNGRTSVLVLVLLARARVRFCCRLLGGLAWREAAGVKG